MSLLGNIVRQNKKEQGGAGAAAANNGLSLDATLTIAQLGQDIATVASPAILLSDRDIPLGGHSFAIGKTSLSDRKLFIDPVNKLYQIGEVDQDFFFSVNAANETFQAFITGGARALILDINNAIYEMGDCNGIAGGTRLIVNDTAQQLTFESNVTFDKYLDLSKSLETYKMGDIDGTNNGMFLDIDDGNGIATLGDVSGTVNGTKLSVDDANNLTQILDILGNAFLYIDSSGAPDCAIGDYFSSNNGCYFEAFDGGNSLFAAKSVNGIAGRKVLNFSNDQYKIGDTQSANNGTFLTINDALQLFTLTNVPPFADNAAALGAGLVAGDLYRSGDNLNIVH